ncbi:hypothetical protein [Pseudoduganella armeniaca]|uniref:hypothetical protein n=1 Tax=Pseudoduganella armeniaca TaxID=2072590 RepID=UPI0011B1F81D|nr:hypothetical protein [Pseudoduganella armeniaca]
MDVPFAAPKALISVGRMKSVRLAAARRPGDIAGARFVTTLFDAAERRKVPSPLRWLASPHHGGAQKKTRPKARVKEG